MTDRRILILAVWLCCVVWVAEQAVAAITPGAMVRRIDIRGNRRTQESTIRFYLRTVEGSPWTPKTLQEDIKRLYALGVFENIQVTAEEVDDGIALTLTVTEKPAVRQVTFKGNRRIKDEEIRKRILLNERSTFDRNVLNDTVTSIQKYYRDEGYYFAHVRPEVSAVDDNQVDIALDITEGKKIRIGHVGFTGNTYFPDSILRKQLQTREYLMPVFSGPASLYRPDALRVDVQLVDNFYHDHGFMDVQVGEPSVEINREASMIAINIPIANEGEQYKVGIVALEGDEVFSEAELRPLVRLIRGEIYNRSAVREDITRLTNAYTDQGYAFADATPTIVRDEKQRLVNITYELRPGPRVYIGRIDIRGNERTRDWVIRRELRIHEGELYSGESLRRSRQRLMNLQYFEDVKIDTKRRMEEGLIDLDIDVAEQSTGQFTAGLGFSSVETVVLSASVTQRNLFGRGWSVSAIGRIGGLSQDFSLSFLEPWLFNRPVSAGFSVFRRSVDFQTFDSRRTGFTLTLGRYFGEFFRGSLTYLLEEVDISDIAPSAADILSDQEGKSVTSSLAPRLEWDSRDNQFNPSQGSHQILEFEVAGLGGDNRFYRMIGESTWYYPLPLGLTGFVKGRFGYAAGYAGEELPVQERFFLGGPTTVRGFGFREIGPQDLDDNPLGGTSLIQFNFEVGRNLGRIFRLVAFMDAGNVYAEAEQFDLGELRSAVGFGIRVITPVGPMRLDFGFKLDRRPDEKLMEIGFLLGRF
jgi:outer membrane protein insertion porin family